MVRALWKAALILIAGSGVVGCSGNAKFVKEDATGGIVAIPSNSWLRPLYRDEAISMIKERNPSFTEADIIREQEVTVGQRTESIELTDRLGDDKKKADVKANVTATQEVKEYWIEYKIAAKPIAGSIMKPGVTPKNIQPVGNVERPRGEVGTGANTDTGSSVFPAGGIPRQVGHPSMNGQGTGMPNGMR